MSEESSILKEIKKDIEAERKKSVSGWAFLKVVAVSYLCGVAILFFKKSTVTTIFFIPLVSIFMSMLLVAGFSFFVFLVYPFIQTVLISKSDEKFEIKENSFIISSFILSLAISFIWH